MIGSVTSATVFADANLLPNGDFSSANQITGWTRQFSPPTNQLFWSNDDAEGSASSGSLEMDTDSASLDGDALASSTCFAVFPGSTYSYGGQSRSASGSSVVIFSCTSWTDSACSTGFAHLMPYPAMQTTDSWALSTIASGALPADASSVSCLVDVRNGGTTQTSSMHFDNLYFNSELPNLIFANGFESSGGGFGSTVGQ